MSEVEYCLICLSENKQTPVQSGIRICGYPDYICATCKTAGWISRKGWGGDYSIVNNHITNARFVHPDEVANRLSKSNNVTPEILNRLENYKRLSLQDKMALADAISQLNCIPKEPLF